MTFYGWQSARSTTRSYRSLVVATEPTSDARPVTVAEAKSTCASSTSPMTMTTSLV